MRSSTPKPLHPICGRPMILYVLDALAELPIDEVAVVVGHMGEWVGKELMNEAPRGLKIELVEQPVQRGTADALKMALTSLGEDPAVLDGDVVVLPGDTPLVKAETIADLVAWHRTSDAGATLLTAREANPVAFDHVERDGSGRVRRVIAGVEVKDGDVAREQDEAACEQGYEAATAIHCFRRSVLAPALRRVQPQAPAGEESLMSLYGVLYEAGYAVESFAVDDPVEAIGVNDRVQLANAEAALRSRICSRWMSRGVTMVDPTSTYVDWSVVIGQDATLMPGVVLKGTCVVGEGAVIGPYSSIEDSVIGERAVVRSSTVEGAYVGDDAKVGPYAVLPPGARLAACDVAGPGEHL